MTDFQKILDPDNGPVRKIIQNAVKMAIDAHAPELPRHQKGQVIGGAAKRAMNGLVKNEGPLAELMFDHRSDFTNGNGIKVKVS